MRVLRTVMLVAVLLPASAVRAQAQPRARDGRCDGPLQGPAYRYGEMDLLPRIAVDLAAVPATVATWEDRDVFRMIAVTLPGTALMLPTGPSMDARIQRWVIDHRTDALDRFFVGSPVLTGTYIAHTLGVWSAGLLMDWRDHPRAPEVLEYGSLVVEAIAVAQAYQFVLKILSGREGPGHGDGQGRLHGPTQWLFPAGTPSGHAAAVYALMSTTAAYWDHWALELATHAVGLYVSAGLVYNGAHFVSDVLFGAALGYFVGRWVVRHRRSAGRCDEPPSPATAVLPVVHRRGAALVVHHRF